MEKLTNRHIKHIVRIRTAMILINSETCAYDDSDISEEDKCALNNAMIASGKKMLGNDYAPAKFATVSGIIEYVKSAYSKWD